MATNSTQVKVELYRWKIIGNGQHPIMIRIRVNGQRTYKATGHFCQPEFWDFKRDRVKPRHPNSERINADIVNLLSEIANEVAKCTQKKKRATADTLRKVLAADAPQNMTVLKFWQQHVDELKEAGQVGTSAVHRESLSAFRKFLRGRDISFEGIDVSLLQKYTVRLKAAGLKETSIHLRLRDLRAIYRKAASRRIVSMNEYPFGGKNDQPLKFWLGQFSTSTMKRAISEDAIRKAYKLAVDSVEDSDLFNHKNYFMLSYFLGGMPWADLIQLRWSDVDFDRGLIIYTRQKTKRPIVVTITKEATNILDYYHVFTGSDAQNYVLPVLDVRLHITATQIRDRRKKVLKQVNKSLHLIEERIGLAAGVLTSYVARHTAATQARRKGASQDEIRNMLGQADAKTTEIYLKTLPDDSQIHHLLSFE